MSCLQMEVSFVGEEAVATGGPSRVFWRVLMHAIQNKDCRGEEGSMVFDRNTPALRVNYLHTWISQS